MQGKMDAYMQFLEQEERSLATRKQYRRDILHFCAFLGEEPPSKERVIQYKQALQQRYQPSSVNAKLAAVNGFLSFLELPQLRVKQLKIQRSPFLPGSKELNRAEYAQLVKTARLTGDERLAMLLQTICSTGIRVSELPFITAEAALAGAASIHLKGKHRTILLPEQLCRALQDYLARRGITSGPIFVTRSGRPLQQALCVEADETALQSGGRGGVKSFSPQPEAPVCQLFLLRRPGHRPLGGHPGPLQYQHHPDLYRHIRR